VPASKTAITFGCDSRAIDWASRTMRAAAVDDDPGAMTLSATDRSRLGSRAAWTMPMPPAPSTPSTT